VTSSIFIERTFESAHFLPHVGPTHKCGRTHGHSYQVQIELTGPIDPKLGWIRDFGDVTDAWEKLHDLLDHRLLNEIPGLENPTAENLCAWIFDRMGRTLPELSRVTVWETAKCGATLARDSAS
jgi:6-pyruvoyltetrahydropterin/6-carboxytetrahydropterin synthase